MEKAMKRFLNDGKKLIIEVIDWEDNYQGFVEFESIDLIGNDYYCKHHNSFFTKIDKDAPSLLDSEENWYIVCVDRTISIKLREFLGLKLNLVRAELASQGSKLARFEVSHGAPTEFQDCHETAMRKASLFMKSLFGIQVPA